MEQLRKVLCSSGNGNGKLPVDLSTSRTLRVLDLNQVDLHPTSTIELPMLRTLRLSFVRFHSSTPPSDLISASPLLEELKMLACIWDNNAAIPVCSSSLKSISLSVFCPTSDIIISAPTLHTIKYVGNPPYITQDTLSSVSTADFLFTPPFGSDNSTLENLGRYASNILRGLHNLKGLNLRFLFVEYITRVPDLFACWPNPYASLKDLTLEMFRTADHTIFIIFLLKMHLNLQTLSIYVTPQFTAKKMIKVGRYLPLKDLSSGGNTLKQLKTVRIGFFEGSECELDLVQYLLANASVMEAMQIRYTEELKENLAMRMTSSESVLAFPQLSPALVVLLD